MNWRQLRYKYSVEFLKKIPEIILHKNSQTNFSKNNLDLTVEEIERTIFVGFSEEMLE